MEQPHGPAWTNGTGSGCTHSGCGPCAKRAAWSECAGVGEKFPNDLELLEYMDQPSVQCLVMRARLRTLPAVLACELTALRAMLAATAPRGGTRMAWTEQVRQDLSDVARLLPEKLGSLGSPLDRARDWSKMIAEFPKEWHSIVGMIHFKSASPFSACCVSNEAKAQKRG